MWGTEGWGVTQVVEASAVIVACAGMAFFVIWVLYVISLVLVKTIAAGVRTVRTHGMRRAIRAELDGAIHPFISDLELGPTMADGGEKRRKIEPATRGTVIKN